MMVSFVICMQSISFHIYMYILRASWKISYYLHVFMYMYVLNVVTLKKLGFYLLTYIYFLLVCLYGVLWPSE